MIRDIAANLKSAQSGLRLAAAALLGVLGDEVALFDPTLDRTRTLLRAGRSREAVANIYGLSSELIALRERWAALPPCCDEDVEDEVYLMPDDGLLTIGLGVIAIVPADETRLGQWLRAGLINYPHAGESLKPSQSVVRLLHEECRLNCPVQIEFAPNGAEAVSYRVP